MVWILETDITFPPNVCLSGVTLIQEYQREHREDTNVKSVKSLAIFGLACFGSDFLAVRKTIAFSISLRKVLSKIVSQVIIFQCKTVFVSSGASDITADVMDWLHFGPKP